MTLSPQQATTSVIATEIYGTEERPINAIMFLCEQKEYLSEEAIHSLVDQGCDVSIVVGNRWTTLHSLFKYQPYLISLETVDFLHSAGCPIEHSEDQAAVILCAAIHKTANIQLLQYLIDKGAKLPTCPECSRAMWIIRNIWRTCNSDVLKFLLLHDLFTGASFKAKSSPLLSYCNRSDCDLDVIDSLIEYGADIHATTPKGFTAPIFVARFLENCVPMLKALVERGFSIASETKHGIGVLSMYLRFQKHILYDDVVWLLDNGCQVHPRSIHRYISHRDSPPDPSILQLLFDGGAKPFLASKQKEDALALYIERFPLEASVFSLFFNFGIDLRRYRHQEQDLLSYYLTSLEFHDPEILQLFIDNQFAIDASILLKYLMHILSSPQNYEKQIGCVDLVCRMISQPFEVFYELQESSDLFLELCNGNIKFSNLLFQTFFDHDLYLTDTTLRNMLLSSSLDNITKIRGIANSEIVKKLSLKIQQENLAENLYILQQIAIDHPPEENKQFVSQFSSALMSLTP